MLASTLFKAGTTTVHTATRGYDNFNRLTGVNGSSYTYNARDQRTKQTLIDGQSWEYSYDELGQVIGGVKTAAGTVVATYDYDPFGNVSVTGSVSSNPWQFSSEFRDTETGLIYYNYRYITRQLSAGGSAGTRLKIKVMIFTKEVIKNLEL